MAEGNSEVEKTGVLLWKGLDKLQGERYRKVVKVTMEREWVTAQDAFIGTCPWMSLTMDLADVPSISVGRDVSPKSYWGQGCLGQTMIVLEVCDYGTMIRCIIYSIGKFPQIFFIRLDKKNIGPTFQLEEPLDRGGIMRQVPPLDHTTNWRFHQDPVLMISN